MKTALSVITHEGGWYGGNGEPVEWFVDSIHVAQSVYRSSHGHGLSGWWLVLDEGPVSIQESDVSLEQHQRYLEWKYAKGECCGTCANRYRTYGPHYGMHYVCLAEPRRGRPIQSATDGCDDWRS